MNKHLKKNTFKNKPLISILYFSILTVLPISVSGDFILLVIKANIFGRQNSVFTVFLSDPI